MKTILHLCADIGSDSYFYQQDDEYNVVMVGEDIGVENFTPPDNVHGIIANPVCTDFSTAKGFHKHNDIDAGMVLVNHCLRIIDVAAPVWWMMENPQTGRLKDILGKPYAVYQPWQYGSAWTKKTALWGKFNMPAPFFDRWEDVPKNENLYIRPTRSKPSLAFLHKSAIEFMPEYEWAKPYIKTDADFRSLCSMGFAKAFYDANK